MCIWCVFFGSWQLGMCALMLWLLLPLDVEVTPASTKVHTISASYSVLILVSLLAAFVNVS